MNHPRFRRIACAAVAAVCVVLVYACSREQKPTPQDMRARYYALLDTLDSDAPGASAERLRAFRSEATGYEIADSVDAKLKHYEILSRGRYQEARELARDGEFDAAEYILRDLARNPDTDDGTSAARHLEFEFHMEKARWLLVRQRFQESEAVARELLTRDLNRFQIDEAEKILDYTGHANAAMGMVARQSAANACRQLIVLLANIYVNDGTYPSTLSIADLERLDPYGAKFIVSELSSIQDYTASQDHYSLVAVGKGGERFRIADGQMAE